MMHSSKLVRKLMTAIHMYVSVDVKCARFARLVVEMHRVPKS